MLGATIRWVMGVGSLAVAYLFLILLSDQGGAGDVAAEGGGEEGGEVL